MAQITITGDQLANELRHGATLLSIASHVLFNPLYAQLAAGASAMADHPRACQVVAGLLSDPDFMALLSRLLDAVSLLGPAGAKSLLESHGGVSHDG